MLTTEPGGSYLQDAIRSVLSQTCPDWEVVLAVQSQDSGIELLGDQAAANGANFRLVGATGLRRAAALNLAAAAAKGRYLAFLLADDEFHPDRLEIFRRVFNDGATQWGFSAIELIDRSGIQVDVDTVRDPVVLQAVEWGRDPVSTAGALVREDTMVSSGNLVVARDTFESVGGVGEFAFGESWDLALRLLDLHRPYVVERPMYRIRLTGEEWRNRSGLSRKGSRIRRRELGRVLAERDRRVAARIPVGGAHDSMAYLRPDEAAAVQSTLWLLRKLRSAPVLYGAARRLVRALRKVARS